MGEASGRGTKMADEKFAHLFACDAGFGRNGIPERGGRGGAI